MAMAQFDPLTPREREVVKLLLQGKSNKLIALSLGISRRTVEFHLNNVYAKFQVGSRVELILRLVNTTGDPNPETLVYSTVERLGETTENEGKPDGRTDWLISVSDRLFGIAKELIIK